MNVSTDSNLMVIGHCNMNETLVLLEKVTALKDYHHSEFPVKHFPILHVAQQAHNPFTAYFINTFKSGSLVRVLNCYLIKLDDYSLIVFLNAFSELPFLMFFQCCLELLSRILVLWL